MYIENKQLDHMIANMEYTVWSKSITIDIYFIVMFFVITVIYVVVIFIDTLIISSTIGYQLIGHNIEISVSVLFLQIFQIYFIWQYTYFKGIWWVIFNKNKMFSKSCMIVCIDWWCSLVLELVKKVLFPKGPTKGDIFMKNFEVNYT